MLSKGIECLSMWFHPKIRYLIFVVIITIIIIPKIPVLFMPGFTVYLNIISLPKITIDSKT